VTWVSIWVARPYVSFEIDHRYIRYRCAHTSRKLAFAGCIVLWTHCKRCMRPAAASWSLLLLPVNSTWFLETISSVIVVVVVVGIFGKDSTQLTIEYKIMRIVVNGGTRPCTWISDPPILSTWVSYTLSSYHPYMLSLARSMRFGNCSGDSLCTPLLAASEC
jgi:hypothetical protein